MSKFVNYKKRKVTLPAGCKNLMDLLEPHPLRGLHDIHDILASGELPASTRKWVATGTLADIARSVAPVFESRALAFTLDISLSGDQLVGVGRFGDGEMWSALSVQAGTDRERSVRDFFTRQSLRLPEDTDMPSCFSPELPMHVRYDIIPHPTDAPHLARLLSDLLREVFGLNDESELSFNYVEITPAA